MDTPQLLVTLLGAGGGGAVLLALVNGLLKWLSGASGRERERNTGYVADREKAILERDAAFARADAADAKRRQMTEYASRLRSQLYERQLVPESWPEIDNTTPAELVKKAREELKE